MKMVVEDPDRIVADQHVGPHRRMGRQHRLRAQNPVLAQDRQPRVVRRIGILLGSETGALVLLAEQPERLGGPGQPPVELLQTNDVGILLADQPHHLVHAAPPLLAVETADVVGHHAESAALGDFLLVAAPDFGPPEERHLAQTRRHEQQHRPGLHPPPADDPVEQQYDRSDVNARSRQPQHGQKPNAPGIDIRHEIRQEHGRPHGDGHRRQHPVEHPQDDTPPPGRRPLAVVAVIVAAHLLKPNRSVTLPPLQQQQPLP